MSTEENLSANDQTLSTEANVSLVFDPTVSTEFNNIHVNIQDDGIIQDEDDTYSTQSAEDFAEVETKQVLAVLQVNYHQFIFHFQYV